MTSQRQYFHFYLLILLILPTMLLGGNYTLQHSDTIKNYYIGSYGGNPSIEKEEVEKKQELPFWERISKYFKHKEIPPFARPLSAAQEMNLIITEAPLRVYNNTSAVVDSKLLYDERVFNGGDRPEDHLFGRLSIFISTLAGKRHMVEVLSQPISNIKQLNERQAVVKELVSDADLLNKFSIILDTIKESELAFLNMYIDKTTTEKESIAQLLFGKWFGLGETLNTNATALEIKRRLTNTVQFITTSFPFLISAYIGYKFERTIKHETALSGVKNAALSATFPITFLMPHKSDYERKVTLLKNLTDAAKVRDGNFDRLANKMSNEEWNLIGFKNMYDCKELFFHNDPHSPEAYKWFILTMLPRTIGESRALIGFLEKTGDQVAQDAANLLKGGLITVLPLAYSFAALGMWGSYRNAKFESNIILRLQQQLIQLSRYVRGCEILYLTAKNNRTLYSNLELIDHLKVLVERSKKHSTDFNQLINLLNSDTFTGNASFFSLVGRVLAAQNIITQVRSEFKGMIQALGEIDAAVATAKLYKHFSNSKTPYCFPTYIARNTPYLKAEHFWNPFLNPENAVTNSLEFGDNDLPRTMILTGPNTGGKSTCIEGILINALCAQTIGIAPAAELTLTPFDKITLYARITDDIGAGDSRFQAEVKASKKQLETARNVQPGAFSLNIRDEGIVGTDREVGEGAEERFTKLLAETPNSINLCSTHYKKMIKLEASAPEVFKNYHMQIGRSDTGKLIRHFTLGDGASTINIAMDILQEQGIV